MFFFSVAVTTRMEAWLWFTGVCAELGSHGNWSQEFPDSLQHQCSVYKRAGPSYRPQHPRTGQGQRTGEGNKNIRAPKGHILLMLYTCTCVNEYVYCNTFECWCWFSFVEIFVKISKYYCLYQDNNFVYIQGRSQELEMGGANLLGKGSGGRLRQSPGRGARGAKPPGSFRVLNI